MSGCSRCSFRQRNTCADVRIFLSLWLTCFFCLTICERYDCNGNQAQRWIIKRGSTKVQLAGTNFCLDAGMGQWAILPVNLVFPGFFFLMILFPQMLRMAYSSKYGNVMIISLRKSGIIHLIITLRSKIKV